MFKNYSFFFRIDYCKDWGGSNRVLSLVPLVWKAKHDSSRMREMTSDVLKKKPNCFGSVDQIGSVPDFGSHTSPRLAGGFRVGREP